MCSYFAIGILNEDDEMVNFVVNYFYNGVGNGYIGKLIQGTFSDPLGSGEEIAQNQESGRDQGHAMMSIAVTANVKWPTLFSSTIQQLPNSTSLLQKITQ